MALPKFAARDSEPRRAPEPTRPVASPLGKPPLISHDFCLNQSRAPRAVPADPAPSTPGPGADRAGAARCAKILVTSLRGEKKKKNQTFVLKTFVLFFQATSADKRKPTMRCVPPHEPSRQSLSTRTGTGPRSLDALVISMSQERNYRPYSISAHLQPGNKRLSLAIIRLPTINLF